MTLSVNHGQVPVAQKRIVMNSLYARGLVLFATQVALLLSSGCIVVGFDPKTEIRTHEVQETPNNISNVLEEDSFAQSISTVEKPEITVSREKDNTIRVEVCAAQTIQYRYITTRYREKWEIEDGRALSIGLFPGYGRILYYKDSYSSNPIIVSLALHPLYACFAHIGYCAPTLSSLLYAPFDDGVSDLARYGIIGCDRFPTGKSVGEERVLQEMEKAFGKISRSIGNRQGLATCVMATVDIPAIWYRKSVLIPPQFSTDRIVSSATLELPISVPPGTECTVSLSFTDEYGKYGPLLQPYEGTTARFEL